MKNFSHTISGFFESPIARRVLLAVITLCIAILIFAAGIAVGVRKTEFRHQFSDNYERNFGAFERHGKGMLPPLPGENFPNAHGAVGKIISVSLPTFIVDSPDGTEKVIHVSDTTHIRTIDGDGTSANIIPENVAVVVGEPNTNGQIDATFIRVLPKPIN